MQAADLVCARCSSSVGVRALAPDLALCCRCRRCRQCRRRIHAGGGFERGEGNTRLRVYHAGCVERCPSCAAWSCDADNVYMSGGTVYCSRHCHHCHALDPAEWRQLDDVVMCGDCDRQARADHCELCTEWLQLAIN